MFCLDWLQAESNTLAGITPVTGKETEPTLSMMPTKPQVEAMKTEKPVLAVLCVVSFLWVVRMVVGIVGLAQHQEVPVASVVFELTMFLGAGLLPLLAISTAKPRKWLNVLWVPCILYVCLITANYTRINLMGGGLRLLLWLGIAVLFVRTWRKAAGVSSAGRGLS